ncbi:MAG: hypothetical protein V2A61_01445 [Calditrichota bacterium]
MKLNIFHFALTALLCCSLASCDKSGDSGNPEIDFGIYAGTGSWDISVAAVNAAACSSGFSAELFNENDLFKDGLSRYRAVILPGGNPPEMASAIGDVGRSRVKNFVQFGGGLIALGGGAAICDTMRGANPGIGLFPGQASWPVDRIAAFPELIMTDITRTNSDHDISAGSKPRYWTLYRWGPEFLTNDPSVAILYRYEVTGSPAAVAFYQNAGRVFLCGCQLEIEENSRRDGSDFGSEWNDPDSEWDLLENAMYYCLTQTF